MLVNNLSLRSVSLRNVSAGEPVPAPEFTDCSVNGG